MFRMRSRFVERLPPAGRRPESSKCGLFDGERLPAATGRRGVRVLDREAAAGDRIDEVDFGAVEITDADRVDEELHAVRLVDLVAGALAVFLDHEAVLEAGTAATLHEDPQAAARLVLFGEKLVDLACGHR